MSKTTTYTRNGVEFRRCSSCHIEKENTKEFFRAKSQNRPGLRSTCIQCEYAAHKVYREKNKEKIKAKKAEYNKDLKEAVLRLKDNPCTDCGQKFHHSAMDFDHISGDKIDSIANMVNGGKGKLVFEEIEKCELVCSNCHRVRTYNRRHDPLS